MAERFDRAIGEYVTAQLVNAERAEAYMNLGTLYVDMGDAVQAEGGVSDRDRNFPRGATLTDSKTGHGIDVAIEARLVGEDTGADVLLNLAGQFEGVLAHYRAVTREPSPENLPR